jgi:hypothetical protein
VGGPGQEIIFVVGLKVPMVTFGDIRIVGKERLLSTCLRNNSECDQESDSESSMHLDIPWNLPCMRPTQNYETLHAPNGERAFDLREICTRLMVSNQGPWNK